MSMRPLPRGSPLCKSSLGTSEGRTVPPAGGSRPSVFHLLSTCPSLSTAVGPGLWEKRTKHDCTFLTLATSPPPCILGVCSWLEAAGAVSQAPGEWHTQVWSPPLHGAHFLPSSLPETQGPRRLVLWLAKREASQPVAFKPQVRTKTPRGLSAANSGAKWAPGIKKQERPLSG